MNTLDIPKINLSQLDYDTLRELGDKPAFIRFNRRVRAILIPVNDEQEAIGIMDDCGLLTQFKRKDSDDHSDL